jgi:hypothetical protein
MLGPALAGGHRSGVINSGRQRFSGLLRNQALGDRCYVDAWAGAADWLVGAFAA